MGPASVILMCQVISLVVIGTKIWIIADYSGEAPLPHIPLPDNLGPQCLAPLASYAFYGSNLLE